MTAASFRLFATEAVLGVLDTQAQRRGSPPGAGRASVRLGLLSTTCTTSVAQLPGHDRLGLDT